MYGGRIAEVGTAADVLDRPSHPYTRALLRSRLTLMTDRSRPLLTLPGEPPDPRSHPAGCPFGPRCERHVDACDAVLPELAPAAGHPGSSACPRDGEISEAERRALDPWAAPSITLSHYGTPHVPALVASGVTKTFRVKSGFRKKATLHALGGVDLEVSQGECVALVGESGSGKSTFLRVVADLLRADAGSVEVGGGGRPQIVFQDAGASMTPWRTVGQLIDERLRSEITFAPERKARVAEALTLVGLPVEAAEAKASQLSGGQRQRAAIARAIAVPPALLLCDEPTSALDVSLAATILNLIGRLRRELGMSVLFVTHDLAAARLVADRIAVMYLGRVVEVVPSNEIGTRRLHPYAAALLDAVPEAGRVSVPLDGDPASPLDPPSGCAFHPRCPEATDICRAERPTLTVTDSSVSLDPRESSTVAAVACHHRGST